MCTTDQMERLNLTSFLYSQTTRLVVHLVIYDSFLASFPHLCNFASTANASGSFRFIYIRFFFLNYSCRPDDRGKCKLMWIAYTLSLYMLCSYELNSVLRDSRIMWYLQIFVTETSLHSLHIYTFTINRTTSLRQPSLGFLRKDQRKNSLFIAVITFVTVDERDAHRLSHLFIL